MKTFAEFIPTLTAREREIVEAYRRDQEDWHHSGCEGDAPYDLMTSTPPAKEPEWIEREVKQSNLGASIVRLTSPGFKPGDRVRITKIEGDDSKRLKAMEAVIEAAKCIRHWHDHGEGMVVSAEHVRNLWAALSKLKEAR